VLKHLSQHTIYGWLCDAQVRFCGWTARLSGGDNITLGGRVVPWADGTVCLSDDHVSHTFTALPSPCSDNPSCPEWSGVDSVAMTVEYVEANTGPQDAEALFEHEDASQWAWNNTLRFASPEGTEPLGDDDAATVGRLLFEDASRPRLPAFSQRAVLRDGQRNSMVQFGAVGLQPARLTLTLDAAGAVPWSTSQVKPHAPTPLPSEDIPTHAHFISPTSPLRSIVWPC
jgi:hypothetical protein